MHRQCFLLILLSCNVIGENCVVFNFENNIVEDFSNGSGICSGLSNWDQNQYSVLPIETPHKSSTTFVSPKSTLSCMSSSLFPMTAGGTLDVTVFMEPAVHTDQITILIFQYMTNGMHSTVGNGFLHASDPNFTRGWQTMRITVVGREVFNGFVSLMGSASASSKILIDSVRYIPPMYSEESCPIYKQGVEDDTTTVITSVTTEADTTTIPTTDNCVVFNFENNIVDDFSNGSGICSGLSNWDQNQYSVLPIETPHKSSTTFVTPKSTLSCMSSSLFPITMDGMLDVTVFMEPAAHTDQITVLVFQYMTNGMHLTVGNGFLHASDPNFTRGWQTMRITVVGREVFNGFVTLMGTASGSSVVLIDSVRYIPPTHDEKLCQIYKQDDESDKTTEAYITITSATDTTLTPYPDTTTDNYLDTTTTISLNTTTENLPEATSTTSHEITTDKYLETTSTNIPETTNENCFETAATSPKSTTSRLDTTTENNLETILTTSPEPTTDNYLPSTTTTSTSDPDTATDNPNTNSTKSIIVKILVKVLFSF